MTNIVASPAWKDVRVLERDEFALGGVDGNMNEQATSLVARTELLMDSKADISLVNAVGGGYLFYATDAERLAAPKPTTNRAALVLSTKHVWLWTTTDGGVTGTWSDTGLSDLEQAKKYFDDSIGVENNIELYSTANNVVGINIDPANGSIRAVGSTVNIFPIVAGETYTLTAVGFNTTYAILAVSPNNSTTIGKTQTLQPLTATADTNVKTFVATITGFGFLNVKWGAPLDITTSLSIKSDANESVVELKGLPIRDTRVDGVDLQTVLTESDVMVTYPNLYEVAPKTANMYVGLTALTTTADGALVGFPIEINKTYLIKAPQFSAQKYVGLAAAGQAVNGKAVTKRDLLPTSEADVYQFSTTSADAAFTQAFFTTKLPSQSYDVRDTVSIFEGFISKDLTPYISGISGKKVAKPQNPRVVSRFENLKVWAAGDSITQGTTYVDDNGVTIPSNTYVEYLARAFGSPITNHGSSGATTARVVDIITAGSGIAQRDTPTAWGAKDLTDLACFTLMIGTNDANLGLLAGSLDQLPNGKFQDYATANEYAALFPNNYLCNIALLIEFVRWKSPKCEIHIIAPPYRNRPTPSSDLPSKMINVIPYLESVCRHYGVHLIYGIYECGIGYKDMSPLPNKTYSYDGVHFTKLANEIFGKFVAQKVLSIG